MMMMVSSMIVAGYQVTVSMVLWSACMIDWSTAKVSRVVCCIWPRQCLGTGMLSQQCSQHKSACQEPSVCSTGQCWLCDLSQVLIACVNVSTASDRASLVFTNQYRAHTTTHDLININSETERRHPSRLNSSCHRVYNVKTCADTSRSCAQMRHHAGDVELDYHK